MRILDGDRLPEVEVSITARCSLACRECGFFVPRQPKPSLGDPVDEHAAVLGRLADIGLRVGSLAVLGGEATLDPTRLIRAVTAFRQLGVADRIEVVTNGMTPQGLTEEALAQVDLVTVSLYTAEPDFAERWRAWLARTAPRVALAFRTSPDGWDPAWPEQRVSADAAQAMFSRCWYRRHCVTVERGRLFACSRAPKSGRDDDGLVVDASTARADVEAYLHRDHALASCATCTPMMGLPTVPVGVQPDGRLTLLTQKAIRWLSADLERRRSSDQNVGGNDVE